MKQIFKMMKVSAGIFLLVLLSASCTKTMPSDTNWFGNNWNWNENKAPKPMNDSVTINRSAGTLLPGNAGAGSAADNAQSSQTDNQSLNK